MTSTTTLRQSDPLLIAFLRAEEGTQAQRQADRLIEEHAAPLLQSIIGRKFGVSLRPERLSLNSPSQEESYGVYMQAITVLCKTLPRLRQADAKPVRHFLALVRKTADFTYAEFLRSKYPQRRNLRDNLRQLMREHTQENGFALWTSPEGETLVGFAKWQGEAPRGKRQRETFGTALLDRDATDLNLADLTAMVLQQAGGPLGLDDLTHAVATLRGLGEESVPVETVTRTADEDEGNDPIESVADESSSPDRDLERREMLRWFWEEMSRNQRITVAHRRAVLLQRGTSYLQELRSERIARLQEIAAVLEMDVEELTLLQLEELPEDAELARHFGFNDRQEVINRRMGAYRALKQRYSETFLQPV